MEVSWESLSQAWEMRSRGRPKSLFKAVGASIWRCGLRADEQVPGEKEHDLLQTACLFSRIQWAFPYPLTFPPGSLPVGKWTTWLWKGETSSVCHCLLPQSLSGTSASWEGDPTCNRLPKTWSKSTAPISYFLPPSEVSNTMILHDLLPGCWK